MMNATLSSLKKSDIVADTKKPQIIDALTTLKTKRRDFSNPDTMDVYAIAKFADPGLTVIMTYVNKVVITAGK